MQSFENTNKKDSGVLENLSINLIQPSYLLVSFLFVALQAGVFRVLFVLHLSEATLKETCYRC